MLGLGPFRAFVFIVLPKQHSLVFTKFTVMTNYHIWIGLLLIDWLELLLLLLLLSLLRLLNHLTHLIQVSMGCQGVSSLELIFKRMLDHVLHALELILQSFQLAVVGIYSFL